MSILDESRPKEMFSPLPVVNCKALPKPPESKFIKFFLFFINIIFLI